MARVDPSPDPRSLSKDQITARLDELTRREHQISEARRGLHGEIDALRRELVVRLRREGGTIIAGDEQDAGEL
jgi:hypothetical protein